MRRRAMRFAGLTGALASLFVLTSTAAAWADPTGSGIKSPDELDKIGIGLNLLWIIIGAVLVIFMQAGFALVETGFGYVDFAGSGIVHMMGGVAALMGAIVLGPRLGKYGPDGKPRHLAAHHIPMAQLGTFILLFGWFGFNAASTFAATDLRFTIVAANTAIAGAFGATFGMFWVWLRTGKPDPGMMVNGMLAGLVAITAPCAFVQPWSAAVIGIIAPLLVIEAAWMIERKWKVDDPVGAIAVHGFGGLIGVLSVGIFSDGSYGAGWNLTDTAKTAEKGITGILYDLDLGAGQLAAQAIGAATIVVVMGAIALAFFKIQNALTKGGIRSEEADEIAGLDLPEMGVYAYPEFEHVIHDVEGEKMAASSPSPDHTLT